MPYRKESKEAEETKEIKDPRTLWNLWIPLTPHFSCFSPICPYNQPMQYTSSPSYPVSLSASTKSQAYSLLAVAMGLTLIGVFAGVRFAPVLLTSGLHLILAVAELGIIFTAGIWSRKYPLNYVLFGLFPLLSGLSITPYLLMVATGYVNGVEILWNAVGATVCLSLAAVVLSRIAPNLSAWANALFYALIGLLVVSLFQIFIPGLRTQGAELLISGGASILFGVFLAFDIQRLQRGAALGASPFLLALSLYLDIYNLFLSVLRFMTALSGERR
jgi:FtsH-binding integral membrane protein